MHTSTFLFTRWFGRPCRNRWLAARLTVMAAAFVGCVPAEEGASSAAPGAGTAPAETAAAPRHACVLPDGARTFDELKGPASALDGACVPELGSRDLDRAFRALRDTRLDVLEDPAGFPRRLPWLLADNGCEERAPAAVYLMQQWGYPAPFYARAKAKRGKLHLASPNFPRTVDWTSHVAPVVRVDGQLYVLDPAVESAHPITVDEWLARITYTITLSDVDVAICRDDPKDGGCFRDAPREPFFPLDILRDTRIPSEWRLQQVLGRDPSRALGACPPWTACGSREEPPPSADAPPELTTVIAYDHSVANLYQPMVIVGDNFVEGVTTVRFTGDTFTGFVEVDGWSKRALQIGGDDLDPGPYEVTVFNGELESQTLSVTVE